MLKCSTIEHEWLKRVVVVESELALMREIARQPVQTQRRLSRAQTVLGMTTSAQAPGRRAHQGQPVDWRRTQYLLRQRRARKDAQDLRLRPLYGQAVCQIRKRVHGRAPRACGGASSDRGSRRIRGRAARDAGRPNVSRRDARLAARFLKCRLPPSHPAATQSLLQRGGPSSASSTSRTPTTDYNERYFLEGPAWPSPAPETVATI